MRLPKQDNYPIYRCPSWSDCPCHVTISAEIAEQVITDAVCTALRDVEGRASIQATVRDAELALTRADEALSAAIEAFTGFEESQTPDGGSPSCASSVTKRRPCSIS